MREGDTKKVWASIKRSGVPLELEVYDRITSIKEWSADPSQYYIDSDDDKGRQFDLLASRTIGSKKDEFSLSLNLVIECKSIPGNAWVFFPIKNLMGFLPSVSLLEIDQNDIPLDVLAPFQFLSEDEHSCRHYHEAVVDQSKSNWKNNKKGPDNIFEAVTTLTKATEFLRQKREKELTEFVDRFAGPQRNDHLMESFHYVAGRIEVFKPLIVFNGVLCEGTFGDSQTLREVDSLTYITEYRSSHYEVSYLPIDVCESEFLPDYMNLMESKLASSLEAALVKMKSGKTWAQLHKEKVIDDIRKTH